MRQKDRDKGEKRARRKREGDGEKKRGGIRQLLEETDRLKTFRGDLQRRA